MIKLESFRSHSRSRSVPEAIAQIGLMLNLVLQFVLMLPRSGDPNDDLEHE